MSAHFVDVHFRRLTGPTGESRFPRRRALENLSGDDAAVLCFRGAVHHLRRSEAADEARIPRLRVTDPYRRDCIVER